MDHSRDELTRLSEVIGLIYEGATDPARWTKDILPVITEYVQAPECLLFTALHKPQDGGFFFSYGIQQERLDLYANKYHQEDVWTQAGLKKNMFNEGSVILGEELVPRAQLCETKFYKEFLLPFDNVKFMTSVVFGPNASGSMPSAFSFYRRLCQPEFGDNDRSRLSLLLPHISRSLGVMQRLRSAELAVATTLAAMDRLPAGALLLDGAGRVSFANQAVQRMLDKSDGLRLRKPSHAAGLGELDADDVSLSRAIGIVIKATLKRDPYDTPHFSKSVVVPQRSGLGHYTLQFSALGKHNEFGGGQSGHAAIVFIADSAQKPLIDPAALQSAYGLTTAEARVAITMLEHVSAKEVAQVLGVSPHTIRSQTQSIYAKLGVDTRTRFVKAMLGLASQAP